MKTADQTACRILVAGGGTGGHVYPALAIIEALQLVRKVEILYVGGKGGIETKIVPSRNLRMETLWISGIIRGLTLRNLLFPFKLLSSLMKSFRIVSSFRPHVAVGTGGYVSGPPLYVAARRKVPVLIQEQDVYPGLTTRLLARDASRICIPFQAAAQYFAGREEKLKVTGNPVRQGLRNHDGAESRKKLGLSEDKLTVFIFGGSQGARSINNAMKVLIPKLVNDKKCQILWQTGTNLYQEVLESTDKQKEVVVLPYIEDMGEAYAAADIIVCRAGAGSLSELAVVGKAAVLIPYPFAAGNHQVRNSELIAKEGAAVMIQEQGEWQKELGIFLHKLIDDPQLRKAQSMNWSRLARMDAAEIIAQEILDLAANCAKS